MRGEHHVPERKGQDDIFPRGVNIAGGFARRLILLVPTELFHPVFHARDCTRDPETGCGTGEVAECTTEYVPCGCTNRSGG